MPKPLLSIGMIVKNEIRCIEKCLKALQPLRETIPCELVIADTGSTDGTREIAEQYADILFDFEWIDDFSAARNAVMDRCTGKWYLTVDADEYLDSDIGQLVQFLRGHRSTICDMAFVMQRNYFDVEMKGNFSDFPAPRMLRMATKKRYEGSIHESWIPDINTKMYTLDKTILYHDGYVVRSKQQIVEKRERNMKLLRKQLEKTPHDLRCINQCIESSDIFPDEVKKYVIMGMEELKGKKNFNAKRYAPCITRSSIQVAVRLNMPQAEEWIEWATKEIPESIYYKVDICCLIAQRRYDEKKYAEALEFIKKYQAGLEQMNAMSKVDLMNETNTSCLRFDTAKHEHMAQYILCGCCGKLGYFEEAEQLLETLNGTISIYEYLKLAEPLVSSEKIKKCVGLIIEQVMKEPNKVGNSICKRVKQWLHTTLNDTNSHAYRILTEVSGGIGISAKLMDCTEPAQVSELLDQVLGDWNQITQEALWKIIEFDVKLPQLFFQQPVEKTRNVVSVLVKKPGENTIEQIVQWLCCDEYTSSIAREQFIYEMYIGIARVFEWTNLAQAKVIFENFMSVGLVYLNDLYSEKLLKNPENWNSIPAIHQYTLIVQSGIHQIELGNIVDWTVYLRKAIEVAPSMKKMIQFLLEHPPETPQSRELKELANKVKALLSQYPDNDPAVVAIKQSPIYQKVAHLIEEPKKIVPEPIYEQPDPQLSEQFIVLMEQCAFVSKEEAIQQVQKAYRDIDGRTQQSLENYWIKFPLWGNDAKQVTYNIATAFYENRDKFQWMYDHLQDNQSRKVLLAVLKNWRQFAFELMGTVKERRFDDYFDKELIFCDENEVVVDLGGYTGDTFLSYIKNYGICRRYYCYEISQNNFEKIQQLATQYPMLDCRLKGAGDKASVMYLHTNDDYASANHLEESGTEAVEVVAIDEDITDPITFLKMDIEGAEQAALRGCERHIKEDKPKLALSVYHNFEDIWKLAYMVEEWVPGYHFYLRYHGGNLWPSEITLIGLPPQ